MDFWAKPNVHQMEKWSRTVHIRMYSGRIRTARGSSHLLGGSALVHAVIPPPPSGVGLETPQGVGLETPPKVWAWRPPQARPLNFPPGCGPGDLQGMLGYHRPWRPAMHAGISTCNACWDRILDTRFWKYYLVPTSLRVVKILPAGSRGGVQGVSG